MTPDRRAQLALLYEVAATPTPGNVDRRRDHPDLRFEHLIAGALGAADGLADAVAGEPVGPAFERAVAGMAAAQTGGNTQFGALLLLVPLVRAAADGDLTPSGATDVIETTSVEDAVAFFRAFGHVNVAVRDPPPELEDLDVRHPEAAARAARRRELSLFDVMERSAAIDGVAREWTRGFERSFGAGEAISVRSGLVLDRAAAVFLELLAESPDPHVETRHDAATAEWASERARAALEGDVDPDELADVFVAEGINPGTTADLLAAGLFVALERGMAV